MAVPVLIHQSKSNLMALKVIEVELFSSDAPLLAYRPATRRGNRELYPPELFKYIHSCSVQQVIIMLPHENISWLRPCLITFLFYIVGKSVSMKCLQRISISWDSQKIDPFNSASPGPEMHWFAFQMAQKVQLQARNQGAGPLVTGL